MQNEQAEAGEARKKCRFSRRKRARREGNADLAGGGGRGEEEIKISEADADEEKRKCRFSRRKRARREGNADLRGGGGRGEKEIQI